MSSGNVQPATNCASKKVTALTKISGSLPTFSPLTKTEPAASIFKLAFGVLMRNPIVESPKISGSSWGAYPWMMYSPTVPRPLAFELIRWFESMRRQVNPPFR